jgi:Zn-dependent M28 family amino/carboxypeptidase
MKRILIVSPLTCLVLMHLLASCSRPPGEEINPAIEAIASQVSSENIEETISDLVEFGTRYPHEKQLEAAQYLLNRLKEYNVQAAFHEYEYWGVHWHNVIGTIPGKENPEQVVILCAHLDSKSPKRLVYAPGADDDASGCAAVLELARILSKNSFEKTIKFIFFSREETGQNGSKAFIEDLDRERERIVAVINLDMIANGDDEEDIDLVTRPKYSWLVKRVYSLAELYGFKTRKVVKRGCY